MKIIKKNDVLEEYDEQKIINACDKSAQRAMIKLNNEDYSAICNRVIELINEENFYVDDYDEDVITVADMHAIVENVLLELYPSVGRAYQQYRNYKNDFVSMLDNVYKRSQEIRYIGDVSNANTDSTMISTQRSLIYGQLNKNLYQKFFLNNEENQACEDGYIYIHDMKDRLDGMNCFRRDTRFITKDGIKSFYDFSDGDVTMVLSHKGIWRKATVHKYGWQPIQKVTFKKGTPTSKPVDIYCTSNHRWILKDSSETTSIKEGDILYQVPDITKYSWDNLNNEEKKLWCKGFAKGDGSLIGGAYHNRPTYICLRLCGHKIEYASRFEDCGYTVSDVPNTSDKIVYLLDINDKDIPWMSLNYSNILYYIDGLMCADGHLSTSDNPSSKYRGIQVTGELNNYIYDLLNMSGFFVTSTQDLTNSITNYGKRSDITIKYQISSTQNRTSAWRVDNIESDKLNPKAEVWCLDVEEDHSFLLEHGIPTGNCCLFKMGEVLSGGFEMGNIWYNEPKTLDVAFDVISDITMSAAAQQYGGFTIPRVDTILAPYAEKSYQRYLNKYTKLGVDLSIAESEAESDVIRDIEQGFQSWEYAFNTVGSSRGDYPFIAISFGIDTSKWGSKISEIALSTRAGGQGKEGFKKPVLFPKLTFLYDENLHGEGKELEWLFEKAVDCSTKSMYPDYLSLTGEGYIPNMYKQYGEVVSLMG